VDGLVGFGEAEEPVPAAVTLATTRTSTLNLAAEAMRKTNLR